MKRFPFIFLLILSSFCIANEDDQWIHDVQKRLDTEVVDWLRSLSKKQQEESGLTKAPAQNDKQECKKCSNKHLEVIEEPKLFVFMSFSIPNGVWLSLDQEVHKHKGVFVLRGLPAGGFQELSKKILELKEQGLNSPVHINPILFKDFSVQHVPTFVVPTADGFDKVSGNISLKYALTTMQQDTER